MVLQASMRSGRWIKRGNTSVYTSGSFKVCFARYPNKAARRPREIMLKYPVRFLCYIARICSAICFGFVGLQREKFDRVGHEFSAMSRCFCRMLGCIVQCSAPRVKSPNEVRFSLKEQFAQNLSKKSGFCLGLAKFLNIALSHSYTEPKTARPPFAIAKQRLAYVPALILRRLGARLEHFLLSLIKLLACALTSNKSLGRSLLKREMSAEYIYVS